MPVLRTWKTLVSQKSLNGVFSLTERKYMFPDGEEGSKVLEKIIYL